MDTSTSQWQQVNMGADHHQVLINMVINPNNNNPCVTSKMIINNGSSSSADNNNNNQKKARPQDQQQLNCPRCNSTNTKFCYYNNYSLTQPRYFCKGCRRYWTEGGSLRNVPVGGGSRKNKKPFTSQSSSSSSSSPSSSSSKMGCVKAVNDDLMMINVPLSLSSSQLTSLQGGQDLNLSNNFSSNNNNNGQQNQNPSLLGFAFQELKGPSGTMFSGLGGVDGVGINNRFGNNSNYRVVTERNMFFNPSLIGGEMKGFSAQFESDQNKGQGNNINNNSTSNSNNNNNSNNNPNGYWSGLLGGGSW